MATHSSILAWRSLSAEEPGRLQTMGLQRVRYDRSNSTQSYQHTWRSFQAKQNRMARSRPVSGESGRGLTCEFDGCTPDGLPAAAEELTYFLALRRLP